MSSFISGYISIIQHQVFVFIHQHLPCPLPIKSLSSALKASKISGDLFLGNSQDPLISSCVPKLQTCLEG